MLAKLKNITSTDQLPTEIPLILLRGAVLLPKAHLPVPIFDTVHLSLADEGLKEQKLIGLIQPNASLRETPNFDDLDLFSIGTLARITEIDEITNEKMIVTLEGICRFKLVEKRETDEGYPIAKVTYEHFSADLVEENDFMLDRDRLLKLLKPYFERLEINLNWDEIKKVSNQKLVTALTMACPFRPSEKQILLETQNPKDQSSVITTLIEMAVYSSQNDIITYH
ncbi:LON peptidase substrate-binding domain-containing protein [Candidatus Paracaedibacter symbiosus]|uniref:LON peptidase substrate-binding domain-containing protein n=1 Tax=Candidatus Paracaedibacter symbiosus TaxID=244582 RepID=UPI0005097B06|nr:LON peptidase substrate-binding domain-containing protein [Candidatus Paracaedibacter symbiosus]